VGLATLLGRRINEMRKERGLTLKEVADRIHVTASFISQMERGKTNPSLSTLKGLSDLFGVTMAALFESNAYKVDHHPILRKGEREILVTEMNSKFQLLSSGFDLNCEFVLNEWAPGASTGKSKYTHEGVECGYVLSGQLRVELGDLIYLLSSGDSITFPSTMPHLLCNPTKRKTTAVWVNSISWIFRNK
jgi:transcriptional regulator with XRE-family HTH domain